MQSRKVGALISATITLILFVGIPYFLPSYITPELGDLLTESGIDLNTVLNQIMFIGVIATALTLLKGFVNTTSLTYLIVAVTQNIFTLVFAIVLLGVGNIAAMGLTEFTMSMGQVTNTIRMDLRVFIYLTFLTVGLRVLQIYLEWSEARNDAMPPGRIPP
jgi:hypothetical protein